MKKRKLLFPIILLMTLLYPLKIEALELIQNAESGILIEANSGKIIYEKEKNKQVSIASMTKMVAQIIIMEELEKGKIKKDDIVTVSKNASGMGGSQIYLEEGEKISVDDLIKGISVASGNDATVAMAEYISGTEEKFVERMNQVVKDLGLKNTHFINSTGLDEEGHYSSSYDMAQIARELVINHPKILEYSSIYEDYLRNGTDRRFWLVNTNKLVNFYDGADGLKTGHTDNAGYCLAATAKRKDLRLIAIVLGEKDSKVRNNEVMEMLDYGFQTIQMNCLMDKETKVEEKSIDLSNKNPFEIVTKEKLCVVEEKDSSKKYDYKVELDEYKLPIKKGDKIGMLKVYSKNKLVTEIPLTTKEDISKIKLVPFFIKNLKNLVSGIF